MNIGTAVLLAVPLELALYGVLLILFPASIYVLQKHENKKVRIIYTIISVIMFTLSTMYILSNLIFVGSALGYGSDDAPIHVQSSLADVFRESSFRFTAFELIYGFQTYIGDALILYRLYVVWRGNFKIFITTSIFFVANIGVGVAALKGHIYHVSRNEPGPTQRISITGLLFFLITFLTNLSCTALIAIRLWWIGSSSSRELPGYHNKYSSKCLMFFAIVVIESGVVYSACLAIMICLVVFKSPYQYVLLGVLTQVIANTFTLLNMRVGWNGINRSRILRILTERDRHSGSRQPTVDNNLNAKDLESIDSNSIL